jgi:hypothetical protein
MSLQIVDKQFRLDGIGGNVECSPKMRH